MNARLSAFFVLFSLSSGLDPKSDYPNVSEENWEKLKHINSINDFKREFNFKDSKFQRGIAYDEEEDEPDTGCQPRMHVIRLADTYNTGGRYLYPSCVTANQCGGCCSVIRQCVPVGNTTSYVQAYLVGHGAYQVVSVPYQNHVNCSCKCKTKEKDANCNEYQKYNEDTCACACKSETPLTCPQGRQYSSTSCKCECSNKECDGVNRVLNRTTCTCQSAQAEDVKYVLENRINDHIEHARIEKDENADKMYKNNDILRYAGKQKNENNDIEKRNNDNLKYDRKKNDVEKQTSSQQNRFDENDVEDVFGDIDKYLEDFDEDGEFY